MNPSPENHDPIRKLLAIKRHEHPPPGFFNSFSEKVIARIQAQSQLTRKPWWRHWFDELAEQPLLASTYGLLFAGLLVVTIGLAQSSTGEEADTSLPGFMPIGSYSSLTERPMPIEIPLRTIPDDMVVPSSISPVLGPFAVPLGPVDRAVYQP